MSTSARFTTPWYQTPPEPAELVRSLSWDLARNEGRFVDVGGHRMFALTAGPAGARHVILIHGNGRSRQHYYNMIHTIKSWNLNRPIVCNEDSQAVGQLEVAYNTRTSWGYYNNMTKQEIKRLTETVKCAG